ncbi:MAG: putative DNA binding domain-containing protein [Ruminococcus sp.]|nr:putative DNA binding domain-containing protein [Ruminococcus sp.]
MKLIESEQLELKSVFNDKALRSVIAFANSKGGKLYIGVDDGGNAIGLEDADEELLKISNTVREGISPDVTMFVSYQSDKISDKNVIIIDVQKGTASPYYLKGKGIRPEGVYVRQGASTVPATFEAIRRMIKESDGDRYEMLRSTEQELTFDSARKEFERADISLGAAQMRSLHILTEEGIYTNLAALLSDQCSHTIKIAVFNGLEKVSFADRTELGGSVLRQVNEAYDYLDRYNATHSEFEGIHRKDIRSYPPEAIREALLNAVIHRDYSLSGSILISVFDDRIEFVSIGGLVSGISFDDIMIGVSIQRNEALANVFYRLGLVEAFGTGIPRIMKLYESSGLTPEIRVTDNAFKITLPKLMGNDGLSDEKDRAEDEILLLVSRKGSVTRKDVEELLGVSQATAARLLKKLASDGKLTVQGKGKNVKYIAV